jgi:ketosteroid isomerase-like protein
MVSDEQQIRDLVSSWMAASKAGDVQTVPGLITDDVVFLVPARDANLLGPAGEHGA